MDQIVPGVRNQVQHGHAEHEPGHKARRNLQPGVGQPNAKRNQPPAKEARSVSKQ